MIAQPYMPNGYEDAHKGFFGTQSSDPALILGGLEPELSERSDARKLEKNGRASDTRMCCAVVVREKGVE